MATRELDRPSAQRGGRDLIPRSAFARNVELLRELVRRDLQSRHKGSVLGASWSLLNPLLYMLVFTAVFSHFARFDAGAPYPVFLLSALLAWNFFNQGVAYGMRSVTDNATLVKKIAFPRVLLTLSAVIAAFVNYLISLVLLVPLVLLFHISIGLPLALAPFLVVLCFAFTLGLALIVGAANVYFRDVDYIIGIALQVWFFLTPIIYPLTIAQSTTSSVSKAAGSGLHIFQTVVYINPLTWIAVGFQDTIARHRWPSGPEFIGLGYTFLVCVVLMALGLYIFSRAEGRFAEEL